jgi:tetratricopeptide (TPR) repeat protein
LALIEDEKQTRPDTRLDEARNLLSMGQPAVAESLLRRLLSDDPDNQPALRLAGMICHRMRRLDEAAATFRHRLTLAPGSPEARNDLANVLLDLGRNDEVLELLDKRLAVNAGEAALWFNRARALKQLGRTEEAIAPLRETISLQADHAGALIMLGDASKAMGHSEQAGDCYRQAIGLQANNGVAWWSLSNLKSGGFSDDEFLQLQQRAPASTGPQQVYFDFALARAYEDRGDYDRAFPVYERANRLRRKQQPWNADGFSVWLEKLRNSFDKVPAPPRREPPLTPRPVFIVSLPRSGSTLTEQVLAAHPSVTAASELPWIPKILMQESQALGMETGRWAANADAKDWQRLGRDYMQHSAWWHRETPVFTDKLPGNFTHIGASLNMLPDALIVNVRRNARDVCLSCYRQLFIRGQEFSYDLADLASYWKDYDRHMQYWRQRAPERVYDLAYESLVREPETEVRGLLDFLGLEWDERCLRFHEAKRAVNTASAAQVRQGFNTRGIGYWERYAGHHEPLLQALDDNA